MQIHADRRGIGHIIERIGAGVADNISGDPHAVAQRERVVAGAAGKILDRGETQSANIARVVGSDIPNVHAIRAGQRVARRAADHSFNADEICPDARCGAGLQVERDGGGVAGIIERVTAAAARNAAGHAHAVAKDKIICCGAAGKIFDRCIIESAYVPRVVGRQVPSGTRIRAGQGVAARAARNAFHV